MTELEELKADGEELQTLKVAYAEEQIAHGEAQLEITRLAIANTELKAKAERLEAAYGLLETSRAGVVEELAECRRKMALLHRQVERLAQNIVNLEIARNKRVDHNLGDD